jgi:lipopolysaccharide export system permease protein
MRTDGPPLATERAERRKPRRLRPGRIDRYVFGEVVGPFLGGVVFFVLIFLMFQALRLAEFFIVHGVPLATLGKLAMLLSLSFMPTALPVAFLIAVLMAFGRLSSDSELVAMKASGIGLLRLAAPVMAVALSIVGLSLALNMEWVPWGERTYKNTLIKLGNTKVISTIREGTFTTGFFDLLIFADKVDTRNSRMHRVFIYDERVEKNPVTVVADSGEVFPVKPHPSLGAAALLKLYNGSIHRNELGGDTYQKIDFREYKLFLKIPEAAEGNFTKPGMIPYRELKKRIDSTTTATYDGREWRGEFWRRIAIASSPAIFVFLGIGFGTARTRAVRAGAALIAVSTLMVYWGVQTASTIAVQRGTLPPFVAMQIPNLLCLIAAAVSFRRAAW